MFWARRLSVWSRAVPFALDAEFEASLARGPFFPTFYTTSSSVVEQKLHEASRGHSVHLLASEASSSCLRLGLPSPERDLGGRRHVFRHRISIQLCSQIEDRDGNVELWAYLGKCQPGQVIRLIRAPWAGAGSFIGQLAMLTNQRASPQQPQIPNIRPEISRRCRSRTCILVESSHWGRASSRP